MRHIILNFISGSVCITLGYINYHYYDNRAWGCIQLILALFNFFIVMAASVDLYYKKKLDSLSKDINSKP